VTGRDVFLRALRREPVPYTPIWLMRQAGRYLPEYRAVREKYSFFEMCRIPDVAVEVTLQPIRRYELDAAILFSDILVPLVPMGIDVEFSEGKGPQILNPVREEADVRSLRVIEAREDVPFVSEALRRLKEELKGDRALIGFSGAPFTLASYAVEGGHSKDYKLIKTLMWTRPDLYAAMMETFTDTVIEYLSLQIESGADAVQLFDSWVGNLSAADFRTNALPYVRRIVEALKQYGVPIIYFGTMTGGFFSDIATLPVDCVGVDWRIDIDRARDIIGHDKAVQGNMDPVVMFADASAIKAAAADVLRRVGTETGHVFNFGHGIMPGVPVDNVAILVDFVHTESAKIRAGVQ